MVTEAPLLLSGRRGAGVGRRLTRAVQFTVGSRPQDQVGAGQRGSAFNLGGSHSRRMNKMSSRQTSIAVRTRTSAAFLPSSR